MTPPLPRPSAPTLVHAVILFTASVLAFLASDPRILAIAGLGAFVRKVYAERDEWQRNRFGWPNTVTTVRLGIIATLGFCAEADGALLAVVVVSTFGLDGLDGWLARRLDEASHFGGEYDKEVDAFYVSMVGTLLYCRDVSGWWSMVPGVLRYLYVIAISIAPVRGEVPRNTLARYSFAILSISFTLAFVLPPAAARVAAAIGSLVVCWSFAPSFLWSFRRPRSTG